MLQVTSENICWIAYTAKLNLRIFINSRDGRAQQFTGLGRFTASAVFLVMLLKIDLSFAHLPVPGYQGIPARTYDLSC